MNNIAKAEMCSHICKLPFERGCIHSLHETADRVSESSGLTGTWFLKRDIAVEFFKHAPQVRCHLVPLHSREGRHF